MSFEIGETVGDYRVIGILGSGGSGEVYKVEHAITRRIEAIKVLASGRPHGAEEEQRFLREIQLQASLDHPNLASVHNAFVTSRGLALVMELVEGDSLEAILQRGRVPLATGIDYVQQVLSALDHAHAHSVLHRDVKPGNIIVTSNGTVKLTDFGLARQPASPRLTDTGLLAGSPYYMSPEQIQGVASLDARTDIYSLGIVLYEVTVGRKPFDSASAFEAMQAHIDSSPAPPSEIEPGIGPELNRVILTALAKNPRRRFQSAAEFRQAIEAVKRAPPAGPVRFGARGASVLRSKSLRLAAMVALAVAAIVVAGVIRTEVRTVVPPPTMGQPVVVVTPPPPTPPSAPPAAVQAVEQLAPAVGAQPSEVSVPAPINTSRPRTTAVARRGPPPKVAPEVVVELLSEPVKTPVVEEVPMAREPVQAATDASAPQGVAAASDPSPKKRGNRLWRALGRIARPWKSSNQPADKLPSGPAQPLPR